MSVTQLIPTKSDKELAEEYKERIIEVYQPLLKLLDEIEKNGFGCNVGTGPNAFGKQQIAQLVIFKKF